MKIAVCFSGMTRTGILATPHLFNHLKPLIHNMDFFIHTWSSNTNRNINLKSDYYMNMYPEWISMSYREQEELKRKHSNEENFNTYDVLKVMNDYYKFTLIEVEDQFEFNKHDTKRLYLWYSWWKSIKMKQQVENQYGFKYDVVIKVRPDLVLCPEFSIEREIDEFMKDQNAFYALHTRHERQSTTDIYFMANSHVMDIASEYVNDFEIILNPEGIMRRESIYIYLKKRGIKVNSSTIDILQSELGIKPHTLWRPGFVQSGDELDYIELEKFESERYCARKKWSEYINKGKS
jgi:hypothetical protein